MTKRVAISVLFGACIGIWSQAALASETNALAIRGVDVDNRFLTWQPGQILNLGVFPRNITFTSGFIGAPSERMERLRIKLEGFDHDWREGGGEMFLTVRFFDADGDRVGEKTFSARGDTSGWSGSPETSSFVHRRETFSAPPNASKLWVIISSAGGPTTVGTYVVDNLVVSRLLGSNGPPEVLLRSPSPQAFARISSAGQAPDEWVRDGTRPSMAKVVEIGPRGGYKALAVVDDDPLSHAEWHNSRETAAPVASNDKLLVEWNEMHSIGNSGYRADYYPSLPPGNYTFRVAEYSVAGTPTGVEASLGLRIPLPYWQSPWFWAGIALLTIGGSVSSVRYLMWHKMRRAVLGLEQQRALERERLRIARDIHDDLGARVTEISLVSAMAQNNAEFSDEARGEFHRITQQARDLVSALYETVWAVNPENDNLEAVGNYLRQRINSQCTQAKMRCRLHISPLPAKMEISSRVRHNISMAVREAMHNIIKHAEASQVNVRIFFIEAELTILLQDDGCGFDAVNGHHGNGLTNMKRRLEDIGGLCVIDSNRGAGTTVTLRLRLGPSTGGQPESETAQPGDEFPKQQLQGVNFL